MKLLLILLGHLILISQTTFGQDTICETCVEYTLELSGDKFLGSSFQLEGYDISMNLPYDFSKDSLSIEYLFKIIDENDIHGDFIFPNGKNTEIKYSLVPYNDSMTIFMKTSNGWYPWERIKVANNELTFSYDYWYCPPATKIDLEILDLTFDYLNDSESWHQNDDRKCEADELNNIWSMFCSIKTASIDKLGEYNHRGAVIQTTRNVIDELYPDHGYAHTLMDFNNDSSTRFEDIKRVLTIVKDRIEEELKIK
jgi:hypothetical protein